MIDNPYVEQDIDKIRYAQQQMNEALAGKMPATDIATEENVRSIVSNYTPDAGDSSDSSDSE